MEYQFIPEYHMEIQDNYKRETSSLSNAIKGFFSMHFFNYPHESFLQLGSFFSLLADLSGHKKNHLNYF